MRSGTPILLAVVAVVFAGGGSDCLAMATPEQAMQCCKSMPCSRHGHHGQECCKAMSTVQAPFVQSASAPETFLVFVALAALPVSSEFPALDSSASGVAAQCHAPPVVCTSASVPLRI
jgi:hypothetical protein